jgi:hypothetical protein
MNTEIVWRLLPRYENFRLFLHRAAKDDAPPPPALYGSSSIKGIVSPQKISRGPPLRLHSCLPINKLVFNPLNVYSVALTLTRLIF